MCISRLTRDQHGQHWPQPVIGLVVEATMTEVILFCVIMAGIIISLQIPELIFMDIRWVDLQHNTG